MKFPFLEKKDDTVYFKGEKLEIIIPKEYFKEEIAEEHGKKIETLGIFTMLLYKNVEDTKFKSYQFNLPETIFFHYSESNKKDSNFIFTLYNGDIFIESLKIPKTFKNTEAFTKIHYNKRIPNTVEYRNIIKLYLENMMTNDSDLNLPASVLEMMIGELARDKDNVDIPFRKAINREGVNQLDYVQVSIKDLAMINSTFTAITSENINQAITSGISKSRTNGQEAETPIEKTIKY